VVRSVTSIARVVDRSGFTKPPASLSPLHAQADNVEPPKALIDGLDRSHPTRAVTALPLLASPLASTASDDPRDPSNLADAA
jgi:hypothetical protein